MIRRHGTSVEIEWAVYSKLPGDASDYRTVFCSDARYTPDQFNTWIRPFIPGASPRKGELWVFVTPAGPDSHGSLGVGFVRTTAHFDHYRQPFLAIDYFVVPFAALADTGATYRQLVDILQQVEIPARKGPISISLQKPKPGTDEEIVGRLGLERLSTLTLAMLKGNVALLDLAREAPEASLELFDGMSALLPYGLRSQMSVATWAEAGLGHQIHLFPTTNARPDQTAFFWQEPSGSRPAQALESGRALSELIQSFPVRRWLDVMATTTRPISFVEAAGLLNRHQVAWRVWNGVLRGVASEDDVAAALAVDASSTLLPNQIDELVCYLLERPSRTSIEAAAQRWNPRLLGRTVDSAVRHAIARPDGVLLGCYLNLVERHGYGFEMDLALLEVQRPGALPGELVIDLAERLGRLDDPQMGQLARHLAKWPAQVLLDVATTGMRFSSEDVRRLMISAGSERSERSRFADGIRAICLDADLNPFRLEWLSDGSGLSNEQLASVFLLFRLARKSNLLPFTLARWAAPNATSAVAARIGDAIRLFMTAEPPSGPMVAQSHFLRLSAGGEPIELWSDLARSPDGELARYASEFAKLMSLSTEPRRAVVFKELCAVLSVSTDSAPGAQEAVLRLLHQYTSSYRGTDAGEARERVIAAILRTQSTYLSASATELWRQEMATDRMTSPGAAAVELLAGANDADPATLARLIGRAYLDPFMRRQVDPAIGDQAMVARAGGAQALEEAVAAFLLAGNDVGDEAMDAHGAFVFSLANGAFGPQAAREFVAWAGRALPTEAGRLGNLVRALHRASPSSANQIERRYELAVNGRRQSPRRTE